jgi:hypothetical protein
MRDFKAKETERREIKNDRGELRPEIERRRIKIKMPYLC